MEVAGIEVGGVEYIIDDGDGRILTRQPFLKQMRKRLIIVHADTVCERVSQQQNTCLRLSSIHNSCHSQPRRIIVK